MGIYYVLAQVDIMQLKWKLFLLKCMERVEEFDQKCTFNMKIFVKEL